MMVFMISAVLGVLALLFRLAAVFRLTIPLLYVVVMNTVCHSWYQAHSLWGDRLFLSCSAWSLCPGCFLWWGGSGASFRRSRRTAPL